MRFQELSSSVEVPAQDFEDYAKIISRSLSSGHDAISKRVMDFMQKAMHGAGVTITSNFLPFEFVVGPGGDVERIVVELGVRKEADVFHVTSKKFRHYNCQSSRSPANNQVTSSAVLASREPRADDANGDQFNGYYDALTRGFAKGNRNQCNSNTCSNVDGEQTCRICFENRCPIDNSRELILPCNCSSPIHVECLRRWQQVQIEQAPPASKEAVAARAATCEVCGALLCMDGTRVKPPMRIAICRPDALEPIANAVGLKKKCEAPRGKVPLRRFPASTSATNVFTGSSVEGGQQLEVIEPDTSGEFFRVRVLNASKYQEPQGHNVDANPVAVAQGWIHHVYLDWPGSAFSNWTPPNSHPENPPCNPSRLLMI